ncbi:hypothetical protein BD779DRAFT_1472402 [Infundibulicybe gibba]|nr:hypothetical protein BD779DRAFT_1472402 [Infundibulicybe gibba]
MWSMQRMVTRAGNVHGPDVAQSRSGEEQAHHSWSSNGEPARRSGCTTRENQAVHKPIARKSGSADEPTMGAHGPHAKPTACQGGRREERVAGRNGGRQGGTAGGKEERREAGGAGGGEEWREHRYSNYPTCFANKRREHAPTGCITQVSGTPPSQMGSVL